MDGKSGNQLLIIENVVGVPKFLELLVNCLQYDEDSCRMNRKCIIIFQGQEAAHELEDES